MHKKHILTIFFMTFIVSMIIVNSQPNKENVRNKKDIVSEKSSNENDNDADKSYKIELIRNNAENNQTNNETRASKNLYLPSFNVYFDYNGGDKGIESKQVIYQNEYGNLPVPTKKGYTFIGWYTERDSGEKIESTSKETIKADHTLYAHYIVNNYSIIYDYNYLKDNLYRKLTNKSLWNNDFDILMDDDIFLNENVYKFKPNLNDTSIKYKEKIKLEEGKTYTFSVYVKTNTEKNLLIGLDGELINIKTNSSWQRFTKTFNAKENDYESFIFNLDDNIAWNDDDIVEIYGLMLSEGGLNKREELKSYNEKLGKLDNPIREGYIFDGWYTDLTFKEKINSDIMVDSDEIYYARWSPNMYKLKIDLNGGIYDEDKSNVIFIQGFETIKKLDEPKSSYKITYNLNNTGAVNNKTENIIDRPFKGFIDDKNNLYESDVYIFNKDLKLKASYDENVNVTLDSIFKTDYTCSWNTKSDGSGKKYDGNSNITINRDITLYADCKHNIKFIRPIKSGCITSEYGYRIHPIYGYSKFHSGIDMSGNDKNIYPVLDGRVAKTGYNSSMGNYIIIYHTMNGKNYTSAYYHLELKYVNEGDLVTHDTIIGKMGQTGAATGVHLHLTMYDGHLYNESSKMVNPRDYINFPSKLYNYWQDRGE